jgi:hypothetical protein
MSSFALLDVEEDLAVYSESSEEEAPASQLLSPLSKKQRARQRKKLSKASSRNLTDLDEPAAAPDEPVTVPDVAEAVVDAVAEPFDANAVPTGKTSGPSLTASSASDEYYDDQSSSSEDDATQVQATSPVVPSSAQFDLGSVPSTPRRPKRDAVGAPASKDHLPNSKMRSIITRTVWTFLMFAGFICGRQRIFALTS